MQSLQVNVEASKFVSSISPGLKVSKLVFKDVSEVSVQALAGRASTLFGVELSKSREAALSDLERVVMLEKKASSLSKCLGIKSNGSSTSPSRPLMPILFDLMLFNRVSLMFNLVSRLQGVKDGSHQL